MLKKTIKYTDFDGVEREEDFYFNFTKAEVTEIEFQEPGGFEKRIEKIVKEQDGVKIISLFKNIILDAYGEKSPDGRRFIKTPEVRQAFEQTNAYSELFMELATDADKAAAFVNGIMPADMDEIGE